MRGCLTRHSQLRTQVEDSTIHNQRTQPRTLLQEADRRRELRQHMLGSLLSLVSMLAATYNRNTAAARNPLSARLVLPRGEWPGHSHFPTPRRCIRGDLLRLMLPRFFPVFATVT